MALVSPGVEVNVIDESFYTPAAAGTVPMIFVATATNKTKSSGTGTAAGTTKANAGRPYLITSQRELGETFGDALFYSDNNNNMIHGGELNEYGLQAAYSTLGVSNRAYVVRADLDLAELTASATAPGGEPADGAYWMDTSTSNYGILAWNSAEISTSGGQSFTAQDPLVITVVTDLVGNAAGNYPKESIGSVGQYAVDANDNMNRLYFKSAGNTEAGVDAGEWVEVGSDAWKNSHATLTTAKLSTTTLTLGDTLTINGLTTTPTTGTTMADVVTGINDRAIDGITAALVDNQVEIYADSTAMSDGATADGKIAISAGTGDLLTDLALTAGTYSSPRVATAPHTNVPEFKDSDTDPAPTGSVWIKTTTPNGGAKLSIRQYNAATQLWSSVTTPIYTTSEGAIYGLDTAGGGANLAAGALYAKVNTEELTNPIVNYKVFTRATTGATTVTGSVISNQFTEAATYTFTLQETRVASNSLSTSFGVSITAAGDSSDSETIVAAINALGMTNVVALVDSQNRIVITHKLGGDIKMIDTDGGLALAGFVPASVTNLYNGPDSDNDGALDTAEGIVASNWKPLVYTASGTEPLNLPAQGQLWYNSVVDEVDLLVHNGEAWVGLANLPTACVLNT